jgi:flavorubredoxin
MNGPTLLDPQALDHDIHALGAYLPIPGYGVLPVNAFLVHGAQPMLVDTGLAALRSAFIDSLERLMDPAQLRWIWLTHADADHTGSLAEVLERAPEARVITTFVGMAKLGLQGFPVDRVYLLNPGQTLHIGDRTLHCIKPPIFDAPETTALFDSSSRTLFSSDCFGALMDAPAVTAAEIAPAKLREGARTWATIDSPWLRLVDEHRFGEELARIRDLAPTSVLSSHLPPATDMVETLLQNLDAARAAPSFEGPDQAALEAMMAA